MIVEDISLAMVILPLRGLIAWCYVCKRRLSEDLVTVIADLSPASILAGTYTARNFYVSAILGCSPAVRYSWLGLTGEPLSRYAVEMEAATGELWSVEMPRLFETFRTLPQPRLFASDASGEGGWLKASRLEGYAPHGPRRSKGLQQALFAFHEAWG